MKRYDIRIQTFSLYGGGAWVEVKARCRDRQNTEMFPSRSKNVVERNSVVGNKYAIVFIFRGSAMGGGRVVSHPDVGGITPYNHVRKKCQTKKCLTGNCHGTSRNIAFSTAVDEGRVRSGHEF